MKRKHKFAPRPGAWKVHGEIPRAQYLAWSRMKAQADFRNEGWALSFEDFQHLWAQHWAQRGRAVNEYCLTRIDPSKAWTLANAECVLRIDHLRARKFKHLYETES
jgi:hypothetical protein